MSWATRRFAFITMYSSCLSVLRHSFQSFRATVATAFFEYSIYLKRIRAGSGRTSWHCSNIKTWTPPDLVNTYLSAWLSSKRWNDGNAVAILEDNLSNILHGLTSSRMWEKAGSFQESWPDSRKELWKLKGNWDTRGRDLIRLWRMKNISDLLRIGSMYDAVASLIIL